MDCHRHWLKKEVAMARELMKQCRWRGRWMKHMIRKKREWGPLNVSIEVLARREMGVICTRWGIRGVGMRC